MNLRYIKWYFKFILGKIELYSEASDSGCCNDENPVCTCEIFFAFDQLVYDKNYVEERELSDKDGEKKE